MAATTITFVPQEILDLLDKELAKRVESTTPFSAYEITQAIRKNTKVDFYHGQVKNLIHDKLRNSGDFSVDNGENGYFLYTAKQSANDTFADSTKDDKPIMQQVGDALAKLRAASQIQLLNYYLEVDGQDFGMMRLDPATDITQITKIVKHRPEVDKYLGGDGTPRTARTIKDVRKITKSGGVTVIDVTTETTSDKINKTIQALQLKPIFVLTSQTNLATDRLIIDVKVSGIPVASFITDMSDYSKQYEDFVLLGGTQPRGLGAELETRALEFPVVRDILKRGKLKKVTRTSPTYSKRVSFDLDIEPLQQAATSLAQAASTIGNAFKAASMTTAQAVTNFNQSLKTLKSEYRKPDARGTVSVPNDFISNIGLNPGDTVWVQYKPAEHRLVLSKSPSSTSDNLYKVDRSGNVRITNATLNKGKVQKMNGRVLVKLDMNRSIIVE